MKNPRELEKILKGCGNHRRIEILVLLKERPNLALWEIAAELGVNFRIVSEHIRRMSAGGLMQKRYKGRSVLHSLTPLAKNVLTFLGKLE
jgi:predicted transcriptional regulator